LDKIVGSQNHKPVKVGRKLKCILHHNSLVMSIGFNAFVMLGTYAMYVIC